MKVPGVIIVLCTIVFLMGLSSAPGALYAQTFTAPELLGRPTASSVTVHFIADTALQVRVRYGITSGTWTNYTTPVSSLADENIEVTISDLSPNTQYYYQLGYSSDGGLNWTYRSKTPERSFWTQRAQGSEYKFTITSDSHVNILLGSSTTWQTTLTNVGTDTPDFHIDLGDTFAMDSGQTVGGNVTTFAQALSKYLYQRTADNFGKISHSAPIFLAAGNHEQIEGWHLDNSSDPADTLPVWSINARKRYFLNLVPDAFYSGNTDSTNVAIDGSSHLLENYYAWNWGDALFIVLDPFWYTIRKAKNDPSTYGGGEDTEAGSGDRWDWTLGDAQYNWLKTTLENSTAKYKFVFMHHMTGGTDDYIREGAYAAPYCEWGGYNEDGTTYAFESRRPTWSDPIHQVLVDNKVSAFFHGHDHQFAHEERDGVVYQAVPSAGFTGNGFNLYSESDPLTIRVLPSSGHLRVTVNPTAATVAYVRSGGTGGSYSYTISPNGPPALYGDIHPEPVDCDVDGSDLAEWIDEGLVGMDVTLFAGNFGKSSCN